MKISTKIKQKITRSFEIKLTISVILFSLLILSFFFSSSIESFLNKTKPTERNDYGALAESNFLVEYIDVGQGSSALITLPDGGCALIDGGTAESGVTICNFLKSRSIEKIDYLISTHADADHIGGFPLVLSSFEVKNIYRPFQICGSGENADDFVPYEYEDLSDVYKLLQKKYNNRSKISRVTSLIYKQFIGLAYSETYFDGSVQKKSEVTVFYDGLKIDGEGYSFEFFAPLKSDDNISLEDYSLTHGYATVGYGSTNSNDNSAIFTFTCQDETFLWTGDSSWSSAEEATSYGELDFVESLTPDEVVKLSNISVYLVGHHGSKYSSSEKLLSLITPKYCVISVGKNNEYNHPAKETIERLLAFKTGIDDPLLTSEIGTISFGKTSKGLIFSASGEAEVQTKVSWYFVGTLIFLLIEVFVWSLKLKADGKGKVVDMS